MKRLIGFRSVPALVALILVLETLAGAPPASVAAPIPPPSAPVITYHTVYVQSTSAGYVDEGSPSANFNTIDPSFLRVGRDAEFGYKYQTYIKFSPISASSGGPLPDEADITSVRIRLYKANSTTGTVNAYRLASGFNEGTLSWKNKPSTTGGALGGVSLQAAQEWYDINLAASVVDGWVATPSTNYGIALLANWTTLKHAQLRSDDYASYRPTLAITYTGAAAPPPDPPPPADTAQCQLTYTVNPPDPRPGDLVTITARATDNVALSYVSIMRGLDVLARRDATGTTQTALEVSYSETAVLPSLGYSLIADDLGDPLPRRVDVTVPVTGSGSGPTVTVTAEWEDVERVFPEEYRLIQGDGQTVTVTATASDPDGIDYMTISINGAANDFPGGGVTSITRSVTFVNNVWARTFFNYSASARDREGLVRTAPGESYDIAHMDDLKTMWDCAMSIQNFGATNLSWTRMVQTFGAGECWFVESWGWKDLKALAYYNGKFKDIADGGQCFGFSTMAAEFFAGRISPSSIESTMRTFELNKNNSYTKEYLQIRQAGQLGDDAVASRIDQSVDWAPDPNKVSRMLDDIEHDIGRGRPGIIGVYEGDGGHAVAPWMIREMSDGTTRVYVYDSNRPSAAHDPAGDITDFDEFPYMVCTPGGGWSYAFSSTSTWNDELYYFTYEDALGDLGQLNSLGSGGPSVTDQDIPNLGTYIIGVFGGEGDMYFEDAQGRKTGMYNGQLKRDIPGSAVVRPVGASFTEHEMYAIPAGAKYSMNVLGKDSSDYALGLLMQSSVYLVDEKGSSPGKVDRYEITPDPRAEGLSLRVMPGNPDSDFKITFGHYLPGSVPALGDDFIGREYGLDNISAGQGDDFCVYTRKGGGAFTVEGKSGDISFDVVLRSTESADDAPPSSPYIPGSTEEDVTVGAGETATMTPEEWGTTLEDGPVTISAGATTVIRLYIGSTTYYVGDARLTMDTAPVIYQNRTLLPIRFVAEPLGADVGWDDPTKKVTVSRGSRMIELWIGNSQARVDGVLTYIDPDNHSVVPMLTNNRTMLPVRFITENLDCAVGWWQPTQEVTITYPAP